MSKVIIGSALIQKPLRFERHDPHPEIPFFEEERWSLADAFWSAVSIAGMGALLVVAQALSS